MPAPPRRGPNSPRPTRSPPPNPAPSCPDREPNEAHATTPKPATEPPPDHSLPPSSAASIRRPTRAATRCPPQHEPHDQTRYPSPTECLPPCRTWTFDKPSFSSRTGTSVHWHADTTHASRNIEARCRTSGHLMGRPATVIAALQLMRHASTFSEGSICGL